MSEPLILDQQIKLPYRYTAGPVHRDVLFGLGAHELRGATCPACARTTVPARPFCPHCSTRIETTAPVAAEGTVVAWTRTDYGTFGWIVIDGADNAMVHRLVEGSDWAPGVRVRATWQGDAAEITTLVAFEPV